MEESVYLPIFTQNGVVSIGPIFRKKSDATLWLGNILRANSRFPQELLTQDGTVKYKSLKKALSKDPFFKISYNAFIEKRYIV